MSLKIFHIFFISISLLLTLFLGGWSIQQSANSYLVVSALGLVGLSFYFRWFLKKLPMFILPFLLLSSKKVLACTVCFSELDARTSNALNSAILFLIGCTIVVLIGITAMVITVVKKTTSND